MNRLSRLLLVVTLTAPFAAAAYTGPAHVGREKRELQDSLRDEKRVEALRSEFKRAWRSHSRKRIAAVEARVSAAIDSELRETRQHIREQATEVHRDVDKVREDKREGMNTWDHQDPETVGPDRRSLADDRRDMMKEQDFRAHLHVIDEEWKTLRGNLRPKAMNRKLDLIQELLRLSRYQIQADAQEVREGQQEMHQQR